MAPHTKHQLSCVAIKCVYARVCVCLLMSFVLIYMGKIGMSEWYYFTSLDDS